MRFAAAPVENDAANADVAPIGSGPEQQVTQSSPSMELPVLSMMVPTCDLACRKASRHGDLNNQVTDGTVDKSPVAIHWTRPAGWRNLRFTRLTAT